MRRIHQLVLKWAGSDRVLFLLSLLIAVSIPLAGILGGRMPRGHDAFQYFSLQYSFLNNAINHGEIPQWMPFMTQGTVSNWWYAIQGGLLQTAMLSLGGALFFLKGINFMPFYYAGLFVDECVLLIGVWLLGRRYYADARTRFFVAMSVWGSAIWFDQPWHNFHAYHAFPLILEMGHRFIDSGKWRFVLLAGNLVVMQMFGNMPYELPVALLVIVVYFGVWLWRFPLPPWGSQRVSFHWAGTGVVVLILVFVQFVLASQLLRLGTDEILNYNRARNPDGTTSFVHFLSYAGNMNLNMWKEIFIGVSPGMDYTLFFGFAGLAGLMLCLFGRPSPWALAPLCVGGTILLLSLGGWVAWVLYHVWPLMKFYRHLSTLSSVARLFLCLVAGFGFAAFILNPGSRRSPVLGVALVLALASSGIFYLSRHLSFTSDWLLDMTQPRLLAAELVRKEEVLGGMLQVSAGFAGVTSVLLLWIALARHRTAELVTGLLVLHALNLICYKQQMFFAKTFRLDAAQQEVNRFEVPAFPVRRNVPYEDNPRARPFLNNLLERKTSVSAYGTLYWSTESWLFQDSPASPYRVDHWLRPLDHFMRAFWGQPLDQPKVYPKGLRSALSFPCDHPAAGAMAGITEDKIQVFSRAVMAPSENWIASRVTVPGSSGETLFLASGPEGTVSPSGVDMGKGGRFSTRWAVTCFDANHLDVWVEIPPDTPVKNGPWLYYSDVWHPFWHATVNMKPVPVYRANLAYKAVPLRGGVNFVQFTFEAPWMKGRFLFLGFSALFWIAMLIALGIEISHPVSGEMEMTTDSAVGSLESWRCRFHSLAPMGLLLAVGMMALAPFVSPAFRKTSFLYAAGHGHVKYMRLLLGLGVDVNVEDEQGMTPLLFAAMQKQKEVIRELVRRGADFDRIDREGHTAIYNAALMHDREGVEMLLVENPKVDIPDRAGNTALMLSAWHGEEQIVKMLLDRGADPDHQNVVGQTSLMFAVFNNQGSVVKRLLASRVNPNAADSKGMTALMLAAMNGRVDLIRILLKSGADPSVRNRQGKTALELAEQARNKASLPAIRRELAESQN